MVATDAGNWNNDLLPTGEVVYWTEGSYQILRYQDGQTEQVGPEHAGNVERLSDHGRVQRRVPEGIAMLRWLLQHRAGPRGKRNPAHLTKHL